MCCEPREMRVGGCCCVSQMGSGGIHRHRQFHTIEEKVEILKRYKKELEKEIFGVEQRIQEMEK